MTLVVLPIDPMLVLTVRIEARARLWRGGYEFATVAEMMRPLYEHARRHGLFDRLGGIDGIDRMMLDALGALQRGANG